MCINSESSMLRHLNIREPSFPKPYGSTEMDLVSYTNKKERERKKTSFVL